MIRKMKNGRKVLAFACAAVLSAGLALPVQAADVTVSQGGEMNYVDMTQYTKVLLPTSSTMAFALDPQGLSTMEGATADAKDLAAAAGNIVSNGEVSVVNYGYYPIKVTSKFFVSDSGKSTLVENENEVDADTTRKIYLTVTPSSAKTTVTTADTTDAKGNTVTDITGTEGYVASSESIAITGTSTSTTKGMVFALPGAEYEFTKTTTDGKDVYAAVRKAGGEYGAASFKIGGKINKNADWAAYSAAKSPKIIKLNAVFSYQIMTNDEYAYMTDDGSSHIQAGTYNMIENRLPDFSDMEAYDYIRLDASRGGSIMINLGSGINEAKVKNVVVVKHVDKNKKDENQTPVKVADTKAVIAGATANSTGTILNIPALPAAIQNEIAKVNIEDPNLFDPTTSTYLKLCYEDANYTYETFYGIMVTLTDGTTSQEVPLTFIKYQAPIVTYNGAPLAKATTATTSTGMTPDKFTVTFGNGSATRIVSVDINESKSTAEVSAINTSKIAFTDNTITMSGGAYKYVSAAKETYVVITVTFDSGDTSDIYIPVTSL